MDVNAGFGADDVFSENIEKTSSCEWCIGGDESEVVLPVSQHISSVETLKCSPSESTWTPDSEFKKLVEEQCRIWSDPDYEKWATTKDEALMLDWFENEGKLLK